MTPGGTHTPWQTQAYLQQIVDDAHDAGVKVIVHGIPANHDLFGSTWELYNSLEQQVGADYFAPVDPRLVDAVTDGSGVCDAGWMEGDCFHPNATGQLSMVPSFQEGIITLAQDAGVVLNY